MPKKCYYCSKDLVNTDHFCNDNCRDLYWEESNEHNGVKPKLTIPQIQARLLEMGKKTKSNRKELEEETEKRWQESQQKDIVEQAKNIFGTKQQELTITNN